MEKKHQTNDHGEVGFRRTRRNVLLALGSLAGGSLITATCSSKESFVKSAIAYEPNKNNGSAGVLFDHNEMSYLRIICDLIIPRTETASASDVDTHGFIDNQLQHCYEQAEQDAIINLLQVVNTVSQQRHSKQFDELSVDQAEDILSQFDSPDVKSNNKVGSEEGENSEVEARVIGSFKLLKWLVVLGYATSEEGATKHLQYIFLPPNGSEVDLTLEQVGRAPSSVGFY